MSAIRLLVLGAVRMHGRAHGYQVRNDLEYWGAHEWSNAKPGSIYHALKQMAKQGLLVAHETAPSTAGGPPRTEYEVTDEGLAEYRALLRDAIRSYDQQMDVLSAAVGFIVDLPREEAVGLLKATLRAAAPPDIGAAQSSRLSINRVLPRRAAPSATSGSPATAGPRSTRRRSVM